MNSLSTLSAVNGLSEMCNKCAANLASVCVSASCVCVCVSLVCVCVYAITFCVHLNVINRFMACFIAFRQRLSEISLISLLISHFCDLSANFFPTNFHGFAPQPAVINCANWINCQHAYKYLHSCVCVCVYSLCNLHVRQSHRKAIKMLDWPGVAWSALVANLSK